MTLTGPESTIIENGIDGATITKYTFTVPPVSGHSGQDYGRVRGYNIITGQWDQLDYGTTTNGITFTRSLSPGIYSKLEMYYYTNHDNQPQDAGKIYAFILTISRVPIDLQNRLWYCVILKKADKSTTMKKEGTSYETDRKNEKAAHACRARRFEHCAGRRYRRAV